MAITAGPSTHFNDLPPFIKNVFSLNTQNQSFLTMVGQKNGVAKAGATEFQMSQVANLGLGADLSISETDSLTSPSATQSTRVAEQNVAQILQYQPALSYSRLSDVAGLSNLNETESQSPEDFQVSQFLKKMENDWDWASINGTQVVSTDSGTAYKMGGLIPLITAGSNTTSAGGATLDKATIDAQLAAMLNNGTVLEDPVFLVNPVKKIELDALYGTAIRSVNEGGVNVEVINTIAGVFKVMLDSNVPTSVVLLIDASKVRPVILPTKGTNDIMVEPLAKTGASDRVQIYAQVSVDIASADAHGIIYGLA